MFISPPPMSFLSSAHLPSSSAKRKASVRFFVFEDNSERTQVARDLTYLKRLSEASGGRIVPLDELSKVLAELKTNEATTSPGPMLISLGVITAARVIGRPMNVVMAASTAILPKLGKKLAGAARREGRGSCLVFISGVSAGSGFVKV